MNLYPAYENGWPKGAHLCFVQAGKTSERKGGLLIKKHAVAVPAPPGIPPLLLTSRPGKRWSLIHSTTHRS